MDGQTKFLRKLIGASSVMKKAASKCLLNRLTDLLIATDSLRFVLNISYGFTETA